MDNSQWVLWYQEIEAKKLKVVEQNNKIKNDIERRHDRYVEREEEYRRQINELQNQLRIRLATDVGPSEKHLKQDEIDYLKKKFTESIENIDPKINKFLDD